MKGQNLIIAMAWLVTTTVIDNTQVYHYIDYLHKAWANVVNLTEEW